MIKISTIQDTARTLMEKAAIEIPQDYLDGLRAAAKTEDGDLSSFVLQAMLDNYKAALGEPIYRDLLFRSIKVSLIVSVVTVVLAYPVVVWLARRHGACRPTPSRACSPRSGGRGGTAAA